MYLAIKRCLDVFFSFVLLILLSPVYLLLSVLVKLDSKGPVFFLQDRLGKNGQVYQIYKFRSMTVGAETQGTGVYSGKDDARVTRVGKFIRITSLDELPQLLNILKGDMSFIGPRPPLTYHPWPLSEYTPEQKQMFDVRPGVTGWGQVNGRKTVEWHRRIELNCWYVQNMGFWLDVKILFLTGIKVITLDGNLNVGKTHGTSEEKPMAEMAATQESKEGSDA